MSKTSKTSKVIDAPFDADITARAARIADTYQIILAQEDGWYYGRGLELSHVHGDGKTAQAAIDDTRSALAATVASILVDGAEPPLAASLQTRPVQLNIRMNAQEKALIMEKARVRGFRSVSDYIRSVAIG